MLDAPHNKFYTALRHRTDVLLHTLLWWLLGRGFQPRLFFASASPPRSAKQAEDTELGYRKLLRY